MAVDRSAYEQAKTKKTKTKNKPEPETLNADFSHDYQAGQSLADRKLQAFNQGYLDRMGQIQDFLHTEFLTTTDTFLIETSHTRSLPSSESRAIANNSFIAMLYGTDGTEEITDHD